MAIQVHYECQISMVAMSNSKVYPSSSLPLDMGQFNAITQGKSTFQDELLNLFFCNTTECISLMERNCSGNSNEKWRPAAEELKNISNSIGATELSKVCSIAERMGPSSEEEKHKMVASLKIHLQRLRAFVRNTRY